MSSSRTIAHFDLQALECEIEEEADIDGDGMEAVPEIGENPPERPGNA